MKRDSLSDKFSRKFLSKFFLVHSLLRRGVINSVQHLRVGVKLFKEFESCLV